MLSNFILSAFDWARQVQITPLRLAYVKRKEGELYNRLLVFANKKQEEIRQIISQTMMDMREELINAAINYNLPGIRCLCLIFHFITITLYRHSTEEDVSNLGSQQLRKSTEETQNLVLSLLNQAIAEKLTSSILDLRETYLGTLQRSVLTLNFIAALFQNVFFSSSNSCLSSLEKIQQHNANDPNRMQSPEVDLETHRASESLKQVRNLVFISN